MPRATIWIRVENLDKWNGLSDKSAFVNQALGSTPPLSKNEVVLEDGGRALLIPKKSELATPTTIENKLSNMNRTAAKYCKVGHLLPEGRSRCTQKGCKYA